MNQNKENKDPVDDHPLLALLDRSKESFTQQERLLIRNIRKERVDRLSVFIEISSSTSSHSFDSLIDAIDDWRSSRNIEIDKYITGSIGFISASPMIGFQTTGRSRLMYGPVNPSDLALILSSIERHVPQTHQLIGQVVLTGQQPWEGVPTLNEHPFFKGQIRHLLKISGLIDPCSIDDYLAWDGYRAFAKCIRYYTDHDVIRIIESSQLRGRSGSGFPAHLKWSKVLSEYADRRYVVCNADESDPGAYMHRMLLESNPHLVLEGLMIAAYTIGASQAIIYTRSRYQLVVERLQRAIDQAKQCGLLGQDILHSGYSLEIILRRAPGAYVCGEETALIASLEGKRGMPRTKPPYPATNGLFGKPTLVHNVETLAQVPSIINHGPDWYKKTGTQGSTGTKLFSLSGKLCHIGVVEVPFGIELDEMVNHMGGGPRNGGKIISVLTGGPSGKFLSPSMLKIPVDFDNFIESGLVLGSGSVVVTDESDCLIKLSTQLMEFISHESCGKCIPCREGSKRILEVLRSLTERDESFEKYQALDRFKGVTQLEDLAKVMQDTSLCGLGRTAPNMVLSLLENFRDELEEHVFDRRCKAGVCKKLLNYRIIPADCTGCHICFQKCPVQAIVGTPRQVHFILSDPCTGCGICADVCKFNAIEVS